MGAREFLQLLDDNGFLTMAEGDRLLVGPLTQLNDEWRRQIVAHKPELLGLAPRRQWRISLPGREPFGVTCPQGCTAAEALAQWPGAVVGAM
jgi:hypothetical protein